jgi:hypothetical protein
MIEDTLAKALGLSVHTGWARCVLAGGSLRAPRLLAREPFEMLPDPERFVFHRAAEMGGPEAARFVASTRERAILAARTALSRLAGAGVVGCAVVAKAGAMPEAIEDIVGAHPRIHTAEGFFYRDALLAAAAACGLAARVVAPREVDVKAPGLAEVGRAVGRPWDRDEKIASLAAWRVLGDR